MKQHIFKQYIGQRRNHKENQKVSQVEWRVMFIFKSRMTKCPTSWETPEKWKSLFHYILRNSSKWKSDPLRLHGLYSSCNSPGQNTRVGSLSLLQRIFPPQGLNPGLPHCRQILYQLSYQGSPSPRPTKTFGHSQKYLGSNSKFCVTLDMWIFSVFFFFSSQHYWDIINK